MRHQLVRKSKYFDALFPHFFSHARELRSTIYELEIISTKYQCASLSSETLYIVLILNMFTVTFINYKLKIHNTH